MTNEEPQLPVHLPLAPLSRALDPEGEREDQSYKVRNSLHPLSEVQQNWDWECHTPFPQAKNWF